MNSKFRSNFLIYTVIITILLRRTVVRLYLYQSLLEQTRALETQFELIIILLQTHHLQYDDT